MQWRIYYGDGRTFDSAQGRPEAAPAFDVQAIVQPDDQVGRIVLHKWDWYYWRDDAQQWWGSDLFGVLDQLLHRQPLGALCAGRQADTETFAAILLRATNDPDFPPRSAVRAGERP